MLHKLKHLVPSPAKQVYHFVLAHVAALRYRYPSRGMYVIGVTGTNGKSSTVELIGQLLMLHGVRVGWTTTNSFRVGDHHVPNDRKMTMLGRFQTQQLLRQMRQEGCEVAIVETSSQGIAQYRHVGIAYDTLVFTNLTPEHIEAHGGFEKYKQAKMTIFNELQGQPRKTLKGRAIEKTIIVNLNSEHAKDFAAPASDRTVGFAADDAAVHDVLVDRRLVAHDVTYRPDGVSARVDDLPVQSSLIGPYYFENTLAAVAAAEAYGLRTGEVLASVASLRPIPGRLELFTYNGATIIVDYAPEPYSLDALYRAVAPLKAERIIHVGGACGGGRDQWKWEVLGKATAERDTISIITNEDPYDDDPMMIIDAIADAACAAGKRDGEDLFRILDRQEAINKAISFAGPGDLVLITGKGSETRMAVADGNYVPWDDRVAVRKAIDQQLNA